MPRKASVEATAATANMKAFTTLAVLLFCGFASASDERLSDDCLRGVTHRDKCCEGVPDAWYAHLRNPEDCASFYQCEHGKPTWKACAEGTHWSVEADRCEWPHEAKCVVDQPEPEPTSKPTDAPTNAPTDAPTNPPTAGPTEGTKPPPTPIPTEPPVDECIPEPVCHQCLNGVFPADLCCRDVATYHKLHLADGSDCSSYYQCVNGHSVHRQCPAGLHWSVDSDRCEHPADAKCSGNGNGGGNGGGNDGGNDGGNGGGNDGGNEGGNGDGGAISNDCLSGKISAEKCCENVPYWVDVLLQNNADCHTYFQCVHGKPMVRPCPANLWWSITNNRCEWKKNATCTW